MSRIFEPGTMVQLSELGKKEVPRWAFIPVDSIGYIINYYEGPYTGDRYMVIFNFMRVVVKDQHIMPFDILDELARV